MQAISIRSLLWLLFVRDWPWKLLSFAIALLVYFSLRTELRNERTPVLPNQPAVPGYPPPTVSTNPSTPLAVPVPAATATDPFQP